MRIILIALSLILLFGLLARLLPAAYHLPLYCLFLLAGAVLAVTERRRIQAKQTALAEEYDKQRVDWQEIPWGEEE